MPLRLVGFGSPRGTTTLWRVRNGKAIKKATKSSYKLVTADKGKKITVKVKGSKSGYTSVSKTSKPTKVK